MTEEEIKQEILEAFKQEKDTWMGARIARYFYKKGTQETKKQVLQILDSYRSYYDNIIPNVNYQLIKKEIEAL